MRNTFVLPIVGAAVVTAGAIFLRMTRRPALEMNGVLPLPVNRDAAAVDPDLALPDRLRAQGF